MDLKTKTFNMVRRICLTVGVACIAASAMAQETNPFLGSSQGLFVELLQGPETPRFRLQRIVFAIL